MANKNDKIFSKVESFIKADTEAKKFGKVAAALKEELKEFLEKSGTKDTEGNLLYPVIKDGKVIVMKNSLRVSTNLRVDALERLEDITLSRADRARVTETITIVRDDVLEELISNGTISGKDAKGLYSLTNSYAFSAKESKTKE